MITKQIGAALPLSSAMPCLLIALILLFPRIAIVLLYLFTDFFNGVYHGILLPLIGFVLMPFTLLAYTYLLKTHPTVDATFLVVMFIAVIIDLGSWGGGEYRRRRY